MVNYNRHIFDNIDNEEKAYWLGFIVADGYLNLDKHMLRIKLGNKDKQHLKNQELLLRMMEKQLLKLLNILALKWIIDFD